MLDNFEIYLDNCIGEIHECILLLVLSITSTCFSCESGGAAFGLLGKRTNKYGRDPIVLLGFLSHMAAFFLIFMNIPDGSPKNNEDWSTYMTPK